MRAGSSCPNRVGSPASPQWCQANGVVFVADEVQTGFGRTGAWFASEHEGVVPDLVATAKGLGGGMPIAGVTGRAEIMDAVHVGGLGSTFGGNPVSCAAALAAIDVIEKEGLVERAQKIGDRMLERLTALQQRDHRYRRRARPRGDGRDRARARRRHPRRRSGQADLRVVSPTGRDRAHRGHARAMSCACSRRSCSTSALLDEGLDALAVAVRA